ncbi:hypothetical protein DH86_00002198, partial [Scytalidium sp. 3C]
LSGGITVRSVHTFEQSLAWDQAEHHLLKENILTRTYITKRPEASHILEIQNKKTEDMQQEAIDVAQEAMSKFSIEKKLSTSYTSTLAIAPFSSSRRNRTFRDAQLDICVYASGYR